ncbi:MAG TPA: hypothetical protein PLV85_09785 [Polyangiaceae bacterium]|nr:hypothetical protein [Polyangiaceae bacterium]HPY16429.1 hypothetical protein [Polyangiaceae bacterium]HQB43887.1 hypothetical protein [Polyangiaceae bacterium]
MLRSIGSSVIVTVASIACNHAASVDSRFDDPAAQRPNGSRNLTVVFVNGVPTPVDSSLLREKEPPVAMQGEASVTWDVPSDWVQVPVSSPMRLSEYRVDSSKPGGEPAELSIFHLGPSALRVDETLDRWASSFEGQQTTRSRRQVGSMPVYIVEVSGTYRESEMGLEPGVEPRSHSSWALIGAIVVAPVGPFYFKLLGPRDTVHSSREGFVHMLDSMRLGDAQASGASSAQGEPKPVGAVDAGETRAMPERGNPPAPSTSLR